MKTENTLENRLKFFGLYYRQKVVQWYMDIRPKDPMYLDRVIFGSFSDGYYLQLKPLEIISDEDCLNIGNIINLGHLNPKETLIDLVKDVLIKRRDKGKVDLWLNIFDYLRSKGYALPFLDLTVQDLIDYGWIKLTEQ